MYPIKGNIFSKLIIILILSPLTIGYAMTESSPRLCIEKKLAKRAVSINLPSVDGCFDSLSCTKDGANALCTAIGKKGDGSPCLSISRDGGRTWKEVTIPGVPINANFVASSCSDNGVDALCILVGNRQAWYEAFLAYSKDGGSTWSLHDFNESTENWHFGTASCEGNTCIAAGAVQLKFLIVRTLDKGKTWDKVQTIDGHFPGFQPFGKSACMSVSGFFPNIICYVQGSSIFDPNTGEFGAFYAYSLNNGLDWHGGFGTGQ